MLEDSNDRLVLDWSALRNEQKEDRINWLRTSLVAGKDWGYCDELDTCVILNQDASILYQMAWFEPNRQVKIEKPKLLDIMLGNKTNADE